MPEADVADELYGGQPGQGEQPSVEQRSGDAGFAAQLLYVELRIGHLLFDGFGAFDQEAVLALFDGDLRDGDFGVRQSCSADHLLPGHEVVDP